MPRKKNKTPPNTIRRKRRVFRIRKGDFLMTLGCIVLASVSSYFPYYVYNNGDKFGPPRMTFTGRAQADLAAQTDDELARLAAIGSRVLRRDNTDFDGSVDPLTTASIPRSPSTQVPNFEMIFATPGQALIQDGEDIMPVSRGSRLPDGSTVKSVRQLNGLWQLVTSNNAKLTLENQP